MNVETVQAQAGLRTPRAAAIAGIIFSVLLITSLVLMRLSVPEDPRDTGRWLGGDRNQVVLALNLVPFSGIAFLWFIGVLRDRLGVQEDRFFSTVFLGSGLLFLAMVFASSAMIGGIMLVFSTTPTQPTFLDTYILGRAFAHQIMNIYAIKMAGVFMISTCTVAVRTGILPRWMAWLGFGLALLLLVSIGLLDWIAVVFPLWVLLISVYILLQNYRPSLPPAG